MIQTIDTLKSYFQTGDYPTETQFSDLIDSLVHKNDASILRGTIFIDAVYGDDSTAKIESRTAPFKTIDAAITAYAEVYPRENETIDHASLVMQFINHGHYEWNAILPERNIIINSSYYAVEIDFSNNINSILNEITGTSGLPFTYIVNGEFLTLKNHSENRIQHNNFNLYGSCHTIDTERAGFSGFTPTFITAKEIKLKYKTIKGSGNVFRTNGTASQNEYIGNIEGSGHLVLVIHSNGTNFIDFDEATSQGKLLLLKISLPGKTAKIHFGNCTPAIYGNLTEITGGKIAVICKSEAKAYGTFQGELHFSGDSLEAQTRLLRIGSHATFTKMHLKVKSDYLASYNNNKGSITLTDCFIDIATTGKLVFIETNTIFTAPILDLKGNNTIIHETPGTELVAKFLTSNPTNVSYTQHTAGGLKTNAILNTIITGNSNTEATLTVAATNTY